MQISLRDHRARGVSPDGAQQRGEHSVPDEAAGELVLERDRFDLHVWREGNGGRGGQPLPDLRALPVVGR